MSTAKFRWIFRGARRNDLCIWLWEISYFSNYINEQIKNGRKVMKCHTRRSALHIQNALTLQRPLRTNCIRITSNIDMLLTHKDSLLINFRFFADSILFPRGFNSLSFRHWYGTIEHDVMMSHDLFYPILKILNISLYEGTHIHRILVITKSTQSLENEENNNKNSNNMVCY